MTASAHQIAKIATGHGRTTVKQRIWLTALHFVAFAALSLCYTNFVTGTSEYMGFFANQNQNKIIASWIFVGGFSIIVPKNFDFRSFSLNIILLTLFLPAMVMYGQSDKSNSSTLIILMAALIVFAVSAIKMPEVWISSIDSQNIPHYFLLVTVAYLLLLAAMGGTRNFNLDFRLVYDFRQNAADSVPGVFAYLSPIFSKAIIPFGITLALSQRKSLVALAFLALNILLFGMTAHKGVLLYPLLAVGVYMVLSREQKISRILIFYILIITAALIDAHFLASISESSWFSDIIVRRGLMVPPMQDYNHLEYFYDKDKYYWSFSGFTFGLIPRPYDIPSPYIIGEVFFNSTVMAANTGFIGNGFAQAGLIGVILYSIGVGGVIAFFNVYARRIGVPIVAGCLIAQMITMFSGTDFVTMFMTHGLAVSMIIVMLLRPADRDKPKDAAEVDRSQPQMY